MQANKPLAIQTAFNVRELGGYINQQHQPLIMKRFIRSGGISELSDTDCDYLYDYGVRMVIDLRSDAERFQRPDKLLNYKDIKTYGYSLSEDADPQKLNKSMVQSLAELYRQILDRSRPLLGKIFKLMIASEGTVLFHCTAGKDRTGVVAMLLLKLAEVDEATIIEDYAASYQNLQPMLEKLKQSLADIHIQLPMSIFESEPETMQATLDYFNSRYTIKGYLQSCGLSEEEIEQLRQKLLSV